MREFTLTQDHVTLLRAMYVGWQDCETGAPEIDPKRPYGNSDVARDVAEMLGWITSEAVDENDGLSEAMIDKAEALHQETAIALQIVLSTGCFTPGKYRQVEKYNSRSWARVPDDATVAAP